MSPWEFAMWWEVLRLPPPPKNDSVDAISRWVDIEDDFGVGVDDCSDPHKKDDKNSEDSDRVDAESTELNYI